ncbi:MAG: serine/threonine-protein phosphatase [Halioglobus sp.]|nr:serine/threonine-protein phosphatase [Halioglobus sp.]
MQEVNTLCSSKLHRFGGKHVMPQMTGCTHIGRRKLNEDAFLADISIGLAVVADGMGGHEHGEVASAIVVETIRRAAADGTRLDSAILQSHEDVKRGAEDGRGGQGMGSTVVAAHFADHDFEICWVGDSRAYLWDGELVQITRDHSYVEQLLSQGALTLEQAQTSSLRNRITQAIGAVPDENLDVSSLQGTLGCGQELLLCSDGLNDAIGGAEIAAIMANGATLATRCKQLVDAAVKAGGRDNITVLLVAPDADAALSARPPAVSIARLDGSEEYFPADRAANDPDGSTVTPPQRVAPRGSA